MSEKPKPQPQKKISRDAQTGQTERKPRINAVPAPKRCVTETTNNTGPKKRG